MYEIQWQNVMEKMLKVRKISWSWPSSKQSQTQGPGRTWKRYLSWSDVMFTWTKEFCVWPESKNGLSSSIRSYKTRAFSGHSGGAHNTCIFTSFNTFRALVTSRYATLTTATLITRNHGKIPRDYKDVKSYDLFCFHIIFHVTLRGDWSFRRVWRVQIVLAFQHLELK